MDCGALGNELARNDKGEIVVFFDISKKLIALFKDWIIPVVAFEGHFFMGGLITHLVDTRAFAFANNELSIGV